MGLWVDQNHTQREIDSWVRGSRSKALGRRLVRGMKALGRRQSRRSVGRRLWVEDRFMGSQIGEVEGMIGEVGEVKGVIGSQIGEVEVEGSLSLSLRVSPKMV